MNKPTELQTMLARPAEAAVSEGGAGSAYPHESAHLHVAGEAVYVDDIVELAGTLHAALGLSTHAHARIRSIDLGPVYAAPGVVAVLQARDIPGENNCGPIEHDDPVFTDDVVSYVGQPLFAVLAETYELARRAARKAVVDYEPQPPLLDPHEAVRRQSFVVPPLRLTRGDPARALAASPRRLQGTFRVGGQEQFYLEGQIAYAVPKEDNCVWIWCSTQHPTEMQRVVAHLLGLVSNQVTVEMRRMGGGFGGKESQSAVFCCVAALGARITGRPVKLRPDRDDDFMITGKRHGFDYTYDVGFDDDGTIHAATVEMISHAGYSADLSGPVATRALCHFDNTYFLPEVDIQVLSARTNTQSNTAFRGFGGPQGAIAIEAIVDSIARTLGRDPVDVRRRNFYGQGPRNVTPYGQVVEDNVIDELTTRLLLSSDYRDRRTEVHAFNADSPVLKKGIALTPVKFGISFNVAHYNQAGALVHVYTDGTVLVNHGGTEMGQGLNTKVAQLVAAELGIGVANVRTTAADTSKVANTSATAASTGSDLNGKAAEDAARKIRQRLTRFAVQTWGGAAEDVAFLRDQVMVNGQTLPFSEFVLRAYQARVQLWSDGFYATPKLHWDRATLTGRPFFYFAYGAAVSEVVVDTLTGEWKLLRADLLHDTGRSINPAIDLGQIEGAFIQGMGWLTTEELWWNADGKLMTHSPSTYKIPAVNDCPPDLRVQLFDNGNVEDTVFRSKAVGEPPLLLAFSVFFALRDAISSVGDDRFDPPLTAPATPEAIMRAVDAVRTQAQRAEATDVR